MQEIHHFLQGFLRFILTGYILERNTGFFLYIGFGFALSDAHHSAAFVHLSHQPVHQENQKYKRYQQT